ncbi:MAG: carbamoyltransferase C-terminal domain-containing protein [Phycisphaerae bacterium]
MLILGISELDNDSGAALFRDGKLVGAANEERFTRQKQQPGVPRMAIEWLLKTAGVTTNDLDEILCVRQDVHKEYSKDQAALDKVKWFGFPVPFSWRIANWGVWKFRNFKKRLELSRKFNQELLDWARDRGVPREKIERPDHHLMHAACAFYSSGFDTALAFTVDGWGDGKTATLYRCDHGKFELIHEVLLPHSAGVFYAALTKAAGYRPFRHEGKITGLAAHGKHDDECVAFAKKGLYNIGESFEAPCNYGSYPWLKKLLKRKGPELLAWAYQHQLEDVMSKYVQSWVKKTGLTNVCMAGGVAANVRMNQTIHEIPEVKKTFVFPHMADGGLGWGAARWAWERHVAKTQGSSYRYKPEKIHNIYFGPDYSDEEVARTLDAEKVPYKKPADLERTMAELLADGELIARFQGAMEFGPRALCHRTIMYQATDPTVNIWLNERLARTEFMPFAPVSREEDMHLCYLKYEGAEHASNFMTMTFNCTERMTKECPAVVHIDGTARPQTVRPDLDPSTYRLLTIYQEMTGQLAIINTSFNMHEEPIICSPTDAIRACRAARFRYLAIGSFIAEFDNPSPPQAKGVKRL